MKAIIEFDLNDDDDRRAHERCVCSLDMALALWEIRNNLRKRSERAAESLKEDADVFDGVDLVLDQLSELLEEHNINVDRLIR